MSFLRASVYGNENKVKNVSIVMAFAGALAFALWGVASTAYAQQTPASDAEMASSSHELVLNESSASMVTTEMTGSLRDTGCYGGAIDTGVIGAICDEGNLQASSESSQENDLATTDTAMSDEGITAATNALPSGSADESQQDGASDVADSVAIPEGYGAGWQLIDSKWYYFDALGVAKTGWIKAGGKWYYLDPETAVMKTGLYKVGDAWYASSASGAMAARSWIEIDGIWYYANASGVLKTGWHKSGGKWYWLQPEQCGAMASTCWVKDGEMWYYLTDSGAMKTGWQLHKGTWYYLDASGAMATGWKKLKGAWYYLTPSSGAMKTGRYQVDDTWYVSSASGAMASNKWAQVGSEWYYATASGALKTGWHKSGGKWYWLQPEKAGLMASGEWINDGSSDYFMMKSGAMFTGWLSQGSADGLSNGMFFDRQKVIEIALAEVGYREKATDAQLDNKTANAGAGNHTKYGRDMHAIDPGIMDYADAWCDAFVDWCFVQAFGVENARGLLGGSFNDYTPVSAQLFKDQMSWYTSGPQVGDQVFFQGSGGINHTGIVYAVKNGKIYTVEGNTSDMVAKHEYALNATRIAGYGRPLYNNRGDDGKFVAAKEWCYLDPSGARASGWIKSEGNWHYLDPVTGLMVRGKKVIDGKTYSFNSAGVMKVGWAKESSKWYYYDASGAMQTDRWIGDYYVASNGVMATNTWIGDRYVDANGKWDRTKVM